MKINALSIVSLTFGLLVAAKKGKTRNAKNRKLTVCSSSVFRKWSASSISMGECNDHMSRATSYAYPDDFTVLNKHTMYLCPGK